MNKFNKKGIAFEWFLGLFFLFFLGILFIVFNNALEEHVKPIPGQLIPDDFENKSEIIAENDKWFNYWLFVPVILVIVIIFFIFISSLLNKGTI